MNLFFKVNNIFDRLYTEVPYDMRTPAATAGIPSRVDFS
jgi:hypothetical protein